MHLISRQAARNYTRITINRGNRMTAKRCIFIASHAVAAALVLVFLCSPVCAGPGPATDALKKTLDKVIDVFNDQSLKAPDKADERRAILSQLIRERFDEEEFSMRALGTYWGKTSKDEKAEFIEVFISLLERTYLDQIDSHLAKADKFSEKNILYLSETTKGSYVILSTKIITGEDTEIPVLYLFKNKQGAWVVCDVAIEGVSIAKNYRAQFSEILANSSFQELLAKLKSKEKIGAVKLLKE
jgi:phospholipid transport system substrate-binding protein